VHGVGKRFVYILQSAIDPEHHYTGVTSHVENRLEWHNHGPSGQTVRHRPWSLLVILEFPTEPQALRFERYLKSGSGRAFAKRHESLPPSHEIRPVFSATCSVG
jgi:predicted GIY-YIG superfamily endonuclease